MNPPEVARLRASSGEIFCPKSYRRETGGRGEGRENGLPRAGHSPALAMTGESPGARTLRSGPRNDRVVDDGAGGSRLAPSATAHCSPLRRKCRGVFRSAWFAVRLLPGARTLRVTDPPLQDFTSPGRIGQGGEDTAPYGQEHPGRFQRTPTGTVPGAGGF